MTNQIALTDPRSATAAMQRRSKKLMLEEGRQEDVTQLLLKDCLRKLARAKNEIEVKDALLAAMKEAAEKAEQRLAEERAQTRRAREESAGCSAKVHFQTAVAKRLMCHIEAEAAKERLEKSVLADKLEKSIAREKNAQWQLVDLRSQLWTAEQRLEAAERECAVAREEVERMQQERDAVQAELQETKEKLLAAATAAAPVLQLLLPLFLLAVSIDGRPAGSLVVRLHDGLRLESVRAFRAIAAYQLTRVTQFSTRYAWFESCAAADAAETESHGSLSISFAKTPTLTFNPTADALNYQMLGVVVDGLRVAEALSDELQLWQAAAKKPRIVITNRGQLGSSQ